jgi:hypothetical protein
MNTRMKFRTWILAISTLAIFATSLTGCVVAPERGYYGHDHYYDHDHDHDRDYDRH